MDFDAVKALKEGISSVVDIRITLLKRERDIESRFGELEVELNMIKKLRGFADLELTKMRESLKRLEE